MKTKLLSITLFLFFIVQTKAQKSNFSISVGPTVGIAVSNENFNNLYKTGIGGGIGAYYSTTINSCVFLKVNYLTMGSKFTGLNTLNLLSIKLGYQS